MRAKGQKHSATTTREVCAEGKVIQAEGELPSASAQQESMTGLGDPAMPALPMLSVAGAAIGNTARARMSADYLAPPNVWTAPVVLSGDRKSPVLRAVMQPVYSRQHEAAEQYKRSVAEYEAALEQWKKLTATERRTTDRPVEPGPFPHYYLSDTTTEAIALRLSQQPRGLAVVLDELAAFFSGMNQYRAKGGNDRESYLAFYDAGAAKVDRKSATPPTIFIPRAFVTVTGMIQPGALARALGPAEFDSGLAARFLLAAPRPRPATWGARGSLRQPRDALEEMLVVQMAWAHARLARLSAIAHNQEQRGNVQVVHDACDRAANTFRRQMLALAEYRRPAQPGSFVAIRQANVANQQVVQNVENHTFPNPNFRTPAASNEQGSAPQALPPVGAGIEIPEGGGAKEQAVAGQHRPQDGSGKGPIETERGQVRRA